MPRIVLKVLFMGLCRKSLLLACGAGVSIKPGVERGFASETPGQSILEEFQPANAGDSTKAPTNLLRTDCRPFHGLELPLLSDPGVSLAKPRSTPGFMLAPAPQAKTCICSAG